MLRSWANGFVLEILCYLWKARAHLDKVSETSHMNVAGGSLKNVCWLSISDIIIIVIALSLLNSRSKVIVLPLFFLPEFLKMILYFAAQLGLC